MESKKQVARVSAGDFKVLLLSAGSDYVLCSVISVDCDIFMADKR